MAKYYSRVSLKRMSELLDLKVDVSFKMKLSILYNFKTEFGILFLFQEVEEILSTLVVNKTVWAKIDRLAGVVNFAAHKDPNETLNDWSQSINSLMQLVCKTNHLINKEEMIHQHLHKTGETAA